MRSLFYAVKSRVYFWPRLSSARQDFTEVREGNEGQKGLTAKDAKDAKKARKRAEEKRKGAGPDAEAHVGRDEGGAMTGARELSLRLGPV